MAGITVQQGARGGRGSTLTLVAAVLLGLLTAALVVIYVRKQESDREARSSASVPVVVAKKEIPLATNITSEMIEVKNVSPDAAVPAAFAETARVIGLRSRYPIAAGAQVVPGMVVQASSAEALSYVVPPGKRAVAITTTEVVNGGGHIRPGDFVDVLVAIEVTKLTGAANPSGTDRLKGATTILQNIEVLAVDSEAEKIAQSSPENKDTEDNSSRLGASRERNRSVTLAVDPRQAQLLFLAETEGKIRLALRPFGERDEQPIAPVLEPLVLPGVVPTPSSR